MISLFKKYLFATLQGKIGIVIFIIFIVLALSAPLLAPYKPDNINHPAWQPPSGKFWLGTDSYGQDVLSQLLYGAKVSISVGVLAGLLSAIIGITVGLTAGYKSGFLGEILMRFVDLFLVIPILALMILLAAFIENMSIVYEIWIIGFLSWLWMARSIRSQTLSESRKEYVASARMVGMGDLRIMFWEIMPNVIPVILSNMGMVISSAILAESGLSFLGIGDPAVISWGKMLSLAFVNNAVLMGSWWWTIPPGFCIATLCFSFILIGNSIMQVSSKDRGNIIEL